MTITNGYATLEQFKAYAIPTASAASNDDDVIDGIIESVSRFIDSQTGRYFYLSASTDSHYYAAEFDDKIFTDDIVEVVTLATDSAGDRTYTDTWSASDFDLMPYNATADGMPYTAIEATPGGAYSFPGYKKGVKVTGVFGFPAVPKDIYETCLDIAKNVYQRRFGQAAEGQATITASGVVITPRDLSDFAKSTIQRYRRKV